MMLVLFKLVMLAFRSLLESTIVLSIYFAINLNFNIVKLTQINISKSKIIFYLVIMYSHNSYSILLAGE